MEYRLVSWNVNGIRTVDGDVLESLCNQCDILLLQEARLSSSTEPASSFLQKPGTVHESRAVAGGRAGVAAWIAPGLEVSHVPEPIKDVGRGRSQLLVAPEMAIMNIYVPHGRRDLQELSKKMEFLERLQKFLSEWDGPPLIVAGDFNIAHTVDDGARAKENRASSKSAIYRPELSAWLDSLLASGFKDSLPKEARGIERYTWWPYAFEARARGVGWRLDYILYANVGFDCVRGSTLQAVHGSDHCPIEARFQIVKGSAGARN